MLKSQEKISESIVRSKTVSSMGNEYTYSLIVSSSTKVASFKLPLYSVSIKMTTVEGKTTFASSGDLFADLGKAVVFYEKLIDNLVTPINLPYILEDEISC